MKPDSPTKNIPSANRIFFYNGVAAAMDGKPEDANPHHKGTAPHRLWLDGYRWKLATSKTTPLEK